MRYAHGSIQLLTKQAELNVKQILQLLQEIMLYICVQSALAVSEGTSDDQAAADRP